MFREPSASIVQLQNRIEQACTQVTEAMCHEACHSVVQRFRDCLNQEGHGFFRISFIVMHTMFCALLLNYVIW